MVLDDVEVPGNSMTELMREKFLQLCTEAESILTPKMIPEFAFLVLLRLPLPSTGSSENATISLSSGPLDTPRNLSDYDDNLAPQIQEDLDMGAEAWGLTDGDRFDEEDLLEREAAMGRSNFMLQFMLDTSLSDAQKFPLKNSDLVVTSVNPSSAPDNCGLVLRPAERHQRTPHGWSPWRLFLQSNAAQGEWGPYTETICSVDPSGRGSDETAAAYISQRHGFLFVHEMRAYHDGYSDNTLLDIIRGCKKYGASTLLIESNFGDGVVSELFRKHLQQTKAALTSKRQEPM